MEYVPYIIAGVGMGYALNTLGRIANALESIAKSEHETSLMNRSALDVLHKKEKQ